eukprot:13762303-Alexandrium_andersonii.AAC.1
MEVRHFGHVEFAGPGTFASPCLRWPPGRSPTRSATSAAPTTNECSLARAGPTPPPEPQAR